MIVGAEIIKILFDYSDDEMVDNLMLNPHFQPALHTTSFDEQSLSGKSLSWFRRRCYDYEQAHGVDLYHDCVTGLAEASARMMGIDKRIHRMDSLMVEASIRKLSRMKLIYTCISKLIRYLHKNGHDDMIGHMEHCYDPNDFETFFDQNTQVFSGIIVGIHADKQWFGGQLTGQSEGLSQKSRSAFLAVLFSFTEFLSTRNLSVPM